MRRLLFSCLLLAGLSAPSFAHARAYAGEGVVSIAVTGDDPLPVYRWPGVSRIAEVSPSKLPGLSPYVATNGGKPLAVYARTGDWLLVAWDDAGRTGWIRGGRNWRYLSWERLLSGRKVRVLSGLNAAACTVRGDAADEAAAESSVKAETLFTVGEVREEWVASAGGDLKGWFRWKDANGRLTVRIEKEP